MRLIRLFARSGKKVRGNLLSRRRGDLMPIELTDQQRDHEHQEARMDTDRIRRLENENNRLRDRVVELEAELKFERANADARASALRRQVRVLESQRNNIVSHMLTVR